MQLDAEASKKKISGTQEEPANVSQAFLGSRFANACLSQWRSGKDFQEKVQKWLKNPSNFFVYTGKAGIGKTYLCAAMLNYLTQKKKQVYYTNNRRFFEHIQKAMSTKTGNYESIKVYKEKEILIFDDLGASRNTEWQIEMILDLIDHRYENEMPTVITSNFNVQELSEIFSDRIGRRIFNTENTILEKW